MDSVYSMGRTLPLQHRIYFISKMKLSEFYRSPTDASMRKLVLINNAIKSTQSYRSTPPTEYETVPLTRQYSQPTRIADDQDTSLQQEWLDTCLGSLEEEDDEEDDDEELEVLESSYIDDEIFTSRTSEDWDWSLSAPAGQHEFFDEALTTTNTDYKWANDFDNNRSIESMEMDETFLPKILDFFYIICRIIVISILAISFRSMIKHFLSQSCSIII
ncbi:hypothetical protein PHYBLDRAFT_72231 [Phycomyces blakesleeanus NRRL 1555(-)]|uniref:Uncharacterized protein n=1 Tax=Phycomyces blakesleeanus (strain ATCC 8743b / DSM 1359 / FGSC 10004 / NBRC 33097 / NRRL 1555) TaxID=763407 RepID=A0A162U9V2_PHYB8|nr:hypothetical protein PHYBLDRAFT_72231 [Phycomyces blakesleeanus NRRL 1555(-)]OAD73503.1 hypothetical protein PHYBLDRAFT_72231 [Phycomyces blakesleeanus NRRL 1555(-)]|eukprot:XP_018291543.1 hypothetical protein PHYBLDRAFT_72231 [Phycomyces blakesleeanus NRRL 1555(-)]